MDFLETGGKVEYKPVSDTNIFSESLVRSNMVKSNEDGDHLGESYYLSLIICMPRGKYHGN